LAARRFRFGVLLIPIAVSRSAPGVSRLVECVYCSLPLVFGLDLRFYGFVSQLRFSFPRASFFAFDSFSVQFPPLADMKPT
jgi:hypothetical protein